MKIFIIFFQTRALPYNHRPAIQKPYPNFLRVSKLSDNDYFKARCANTLEYPHIVQWVGAFMAEMNAAVNAPILYDADKYFVRTEFGSNSNPHWHFLLMSEKLSKKFNEMKAQFLNEINNLETIVNDAITDHSSTEEYDDIISILELLLSDLFEAKQNEYMNIMKNYYTNWNSGLTKSGEKTFDFELDRKSTVSRANVEKLIDDFLTSGNSTSLDELYVKILVTCRHVGHTGREGFPTAKDRCGVKIKIVDKDATIEKLTEWESGGRKGRKPSKVNKNVYACKRRMPQPLFERPTIYQDPFKKEITQFCTERNDKWINGGCKFAALLNLNNIDDKGIVEEWLMRLPKIEKVSEFGHIKIILNKMKGGSYQKSTLPNT